VRARPQPSVLETHTDPTTTGERRSKEGRFHLSSPSSTRLPLTCPTRQITQQWPRGQVKGSYAAKPREPTSPHSSVGVGGRVRERIRLQGGRCLLNVRDLSGDQCARLLKEWFADIYEATDRAEQSDLLGSRGSSGEIAMDDTPEPPCMSRGALSDLRRRAPGM
jgi:hypothetical protein